MRKLRRNKKLSDYNNLVDNNGNINPLFISDDYEEINEEINEKLVKENKELKKKMKTC